METIMLIFLIVLVVLAAINLYVISKNSSGDSTIVGFKIDGINSAISKVEQGIKTEFSASRLENAEHAKSARAEQNAALRSFEDKIQQFMASVEFKLKEITEANNVNSKENRAELKQNLETFKNDFSTSVKEFNALQRDNFLTLLNKQDDQNKNTGDKLENMRRTVEQKLGELQSGNEKKLEEMRLTVDEKLQKTLESRLTESFKVVSDNLEAVHKGLGEMQQLANGVGDLKKVLTNVKSRGIMGEYQLENLLEQILTPEQYGKNVKTKEGSGAIVEFAVKLPGQEGQPLFLPIDSKFPKEDYELLIDAYESGNAEAIDEHRKAFAKGIKKCAQDISSKYIDPPNTTDFAILFLPFEGLYAEVLRVPGLFDSIRIDYKVNIAGPSTLSAFLSSLQMGFRTLAIEKRSSEVWKLLGAVKTEFSNFSQVLQKTQKKLSEASSVIEQAGVRTRAIEKKLRTVEQLPSEMSTQLLNEGLDVPVFSEENISAEIEVE